MRKAVEWRSSKLVSSRGERKKNVNKTHQKKKKREGRRGYGEGEGRGDSNLTL